MSDIHNLGESILLTILESKWSYMLI